ncbi:MAG: hypothetical protein K2I67_01885 [Malacoplasma sp.]|nr:hypothetical protein [Malacoplasma sp.]
MKHTEVYDAYWRFAYNRQEVFFNRLYSKAPPWTDDEIIKKYKFTNAYRVTDRVSQYLVKNVIYSGELLSAEDIIFRILLFKFFNKIETWEEIEKKVGFINYKDFNKESYSKVLDEMLKNKQKIYSAAYIMPSGVTAFGSHIKHRNNLELLDFIMKDKIGKKISQASSLRELFELLLSYPTIGQFLAFQYAIDINYSELTDFSEMSFVVPGPGAKRGIEKCFGNLSHNYEYYINYVAEHQASEFEKYNLDFKYLFGRQLQLIDCQNLFCETDKYSRVMFPNIDSKQKRKRIKQTFKPKNEPIQLFLPPKWGLKY